jgi:uncharacterized membrane protein YccC
MLLRLKEVASSSIVFSLRTFAAAMLAMYISYHLDLARPTWAFVTTYIVSTPLRGAGRSKGLYRLSGTLCGASFTVIAIPNLVNAPELLTLALALWVGGCLCWSIIDGTPRSYAMMLAGFTTAVIGFPSVSAPQAIFDTAIARTEEIGIAILCVELMGYMPFQPRAGDVLRVRIEKYLIHMRELTVSLLTFNPRTPSLIERARIMIDVAALDALRLQAYYDTPHFAAIEGWVVQLQRYARDYFTDLMTLDAQLRHAKQHDPELINLIEPITRSFLAWIERGEIAIPDDLTHLVSSAYNHQNRQRLVSSGILTTIQNIIERRYHCLDLKQKMKDGEACHQPYHPIARYIDYRQAVYYGIAVALYIVASCVFWIATGWPEGSIMALIGTVVCCFFASLDAPPTAVLGFLAATVIGSIIAGLYTFVVFPHIDGFPLFAYVMALSFIPIGIGLANANPTVAALMIPLVIGINTADLQNRFSTDIVSYFNGFMAQNMGVVTAGAMLALVRSITLQGATKRLLTQNGQALAHLAHDNITVCDPILDRMAHRSALALVRAPKLQRDQDRVATRVLRDLQTSRALVQIKDMLPSMSAHIQERWNRIRADLESRFARREGINDSAGIDAREIADLKDEICNGKHTHQALRFSGLMEMLEQSLKEEAA